MANSILKPEERQEELEEDGFLFARQIAYSGVVPMVLRAAIGLGVFDIIASAGEGAKLSPKDIVSQIVDNKNPEAHTMLDRVLGLLACHSLLNCTLVVDEEDPRLSQRLYSLSPGSKYFVTDADGLSLAPLLEMHLDKVFYQSWSELKGAILEGGTPFNRVHGMHTFEYSKTDPRFNEVFNKAMHSSSTIVMKRVLELYKGFDHINKLVDVGGGIGSSLKLITSKHPHIKALNFDLPHVIERAPICPGVEHVGGDMFESIPNGDAIFMKWILHDWDDDHCLKLLKNCYKVVPNDGKVIVVDTILPIVPEPTVTAEHAFRSDVIMMTQVPGGKERTQQDFMDLATGSGFSGVRFVCYVSGLWVMEFYK